MKNSFKFTLILFTLLVFLTSCSLSKKEISKEDESYYKNLIISSSDPSDVIGILNGNEFSNKFLQEIANSHFTTAKIGLLGSDCCTPDIFVKVCQDTEVIDFFLKDGGREDFLYEKTSDLSFSEKEQLALIDIGVPKITFGVLDNKCLSMNTFIYALKNNCIDLNNPEIQKTVCLRIVGKANELTNEDKNALLSLNKPFITSALIEISKK